MKRLLATLLLLAAPLGAQTVVCSSAVVTTPCIVAAGTVSPTAFPLLAPNGVAGAPSYSFTDNPTAGLYYNVGATLQSLGGPGGTGSYFRATTPSGWTINGGSALSGNGDPSTIFGAAAAAGNNNGGDVTVTGGAATGSGNRGSFALGLNTIFAHKDDAVYMGSNFTNATTTLSGNTLWGASITLYAGRTYSFRFRMFVDNATDGNGGKIDFSGGTVTATAFRVACVLNDTAAPAASPAQTTTLAGVLAWTTITGDGVIACDGFITVNASGTFRPDGASNGGATTFTIYRGSHIVFEQYN